VTPERVRVLRDADTIVVSEMKASDWYYRVWQSLAVLLPVRSVGVMGDQRTYEDTVVIRDRGKPGRDDGGLGAAPLRIAGAHFQPDH
jgi:GMP synthase PP-ATPase subunit